MSKVVQVLAASEPSPDITDEQLAEAVAISVTGNMNMLLQASALTRVKDVTPELMAKHSPGGSYILISFEVIPRTRVEELIAENKPAHEHLQQDHIEHGH